MRDAGVDADAGAGVDAGTDAGTDADTDAGVEVDGDAAETGDDRSADPAHSAATSTAGGGRRENWPRSEVDDGTDGLPAREPDGAGDGRMD